MKTLLHTNKFCQDRKLSETKKIVKSLHATTYSLLVYLLRFKYKNPDKKIYQSMLARKLGLARETVNRHIKILCDLGLMGKTTFFKEACLYFFDPHLLVRARYVIPQIDSILNSVKDGQHVIVTLSSSSSILLNTIFKTKKNYKHKDRTQMFSFGMLFLQTLALTRWNL